MILPPPVALGEPLPAPVPSAELLNRLAVRRSAPAQGLAAPGPDANEIADILTLAARSPDHGKLTPWRVVVMGPQSRAEIAEKLAAMAVAKGNTALLTAVNKALKTVQGNGTYAKISKSYFGQDIRCR